MDNLILVSFLIILFVSISFGKEELHHPALFLSDLNYTVDEFDVTTKDGYILRLYHVKSQDFHKNRPVVYLQHGLMSSSSDFCATSKRSLVATLVKANFDVWMGNSRGSFFSNKHVNKSITRSKYWKFGWHEIGIYDIPAFIDFILNYTGQSSLHYVSHSQGSTAFFVLTSMQPEYSNKIKSMHALAPAIFMSHVRSPLIRLLAKLVNLLTSLWKLFGFDQKIAGDCFFTRMTQMICQANDINQRLCADILCSLGGCSADQKIDSAIPLILKLDPSPASVYQIFHYAQEINSGRFCMYDYGRRINLQKYNSVIPPDYNLTNVKVPVVLYAGQQDLLVDVRDVKKLGSKLSNLDDIVIVSKTEFGHMDFCWNSKASKLVYNLVLHNILKHEILSK
ncbi:hypothetical protein DMENIID0001_101950 [Sergentomyia squamirostris]